MIAFYKFKFDLLYSLTENNDMILISFDII